MGRSDYSELVTRAQSGDKASMERLAALAQESLRRYVFRITLDEALTQDIVQESMLEMFKVLGKLQRADRFSAWLHGIAFNLLRRHYGDRWRTRIVTGDGEGGYADFSSGEDGLANLVNAELKQIIFAAMSHLEPRHRAVLTMRCYDGMSYKSIAETMEMSEFGARALFFRAKKALAKQLSRRGLGRGSLLTALVLFGKMTAVSEAAAAEVTVTAETLKVGIAAAAAGAAGSAAGTLTLTAAAAVVTAAAVMSMSHGSEPVTEAAWQTGGMAPPAVVGDLKRDAVCERWYYFPEGVNGPVMMRNVVVRPDAGHRWCEWLQNETGNYSYDAHSNTITLHNHRTWESDYSVRRLPTDSPELSDFISQMQRDCAVMGHIGSRGRDLLVVATIGGAASATTWTTRHCNALEEDYFKCDWPRQAKLIDNRDEMHKRGWTYFSVEGRLRGEPVSGRGYLPFVYAAGGAQAWLSLRVGEREIAGDARGACVRGPRGEVVQSWADAACGGIFAGLSRPWAGLHTIDTVRRDAAMKRIPFEIRVEGREATVVLDCGDVELEYTIDILEDLVQEIAFRGADGAAIGVMQFSYMQDIAEMHPVPSQVRMGSQRVNEVGGPLWLAQLASAELIR